MQSVHPARFGAALAALTALSACGGGSGTGGVPITLQGATIWQQTDDASTQVLRKIEGGDGGNFSGVIFIDDGFLQFLQAQTGSGGGQTVFFRDAANQARLFLPGTTGADDYESVRFLNLTYQVGNRVYNQFGYIGRVTVADDMALASGTATYTGTGTVDVFVLPTGGSRLDFPGGNATITADFDANTVNVVMNRPGSAQWVFGTPYDEFRITGMTIAGSGFSGGSFSARKSGTQVATFPGDFQATGFFAGFNDGNGAVGSGDLPGEAAGAFRADSALDGVAVGFFAGD